MKSRPAKPFTGYHMAAIMIGFFGIVIAVNITMARMAIGSFGGTVVQNSYVASQNYNQWLAEADKEARLGWSVKVTRAADGRIAIAVAGKGAAGDGFAVTAMASHPLGRAPEKMIVFQPQGDGNYLSKTALPKGRWLMHVEVTRGADRYRSIADIR
ncbi:MAG: FixH family protein [Parasphingorhabdus sp.]|nr:FixH family protein [Parasphingorhabdus sp.]